MTEYTIQDSILGIRKEQEELRERWQDHIAERYLNVIATYETRLKELDRLLGSVSADMERMRNFCARMEEEEARFGIGTYRKTMY